MNRVHPNDFPVPNSVGVKTTGRVAPVKPVIQKQAAEKSATVEKQAAESAQIEKEAFNIPFVSAETGATALKYLKPIATAAGVIGGAGLLHDGAMNMINRARAYGALREAMAINPKLKSIPKPTLDRYFDLVMSSSPSIATKPILLANYLDYMIAHDGSLNFAAFKQMAELENTLANTGKLNRPFGDMATKSIIDSSVKINFPSR